MNSFYYDILLTAGTFLVMGYLSIRAMASHKRKGDNDEGDGGLSFPREPQIDLPPGVIWPSDAPKKKEEEVLI